MSLLSGILTTKQKVGLTFINNGSCRELFTVVTSDEYLKHGSNGCFCHIDFGYMYVYDNFV